MIKEALGKVVEGRHLTEEESAQVMGEIMSGTATPAQIGGFLTALRLKGETVEEITGCARTMREFAMAVRPGVSRLVDTCGTGGDRAGTFNISTAAAFVVAGAGLPVAKHGNRSVSSRCGSADVLEALGVNLQLSAAEITSCIEEVGIGFLFAPALHVAMKHAIGPRREMGIRTIFNILGPLTNPARAQAQVIGVFDPALTEVMAGVLQRLGVERAMVVHGMDGLDEISISAPTKVTELREGRLETFWIEPETMGLPRAGLEDVRGGSAPENAAHIRQVLEGNPGPRADIVAANAAAALMAGGLAGDLREGVEIARQSIETGRALQKLEGLIAFTRRYALAEDDQVVFG
ncbi:MAG: anthranilate phosphoribosyltransferase [Syntrophothermus sp.]